MIRHNCMLAHKWTGQDPTGWLMSEKLDGVRAIWDGQILVSRNNKLINAPHEWKKYLPSAPLTPLDGELFIDRGKFQATVSIVRKQHPTDDWPSILYMIINPLHVQENKVVKSITQVHCTSERFLMDYYSIILEQGGEGVMLRNPNFPYELKRSRALLKVKPEESGVATVINYQPGEGKHEGRLGALVCLWNNKQFKIGTGFSDYEREHPVSIGAQITFKYQCLTNDGIPRFPRL